MANDTSGIGGGGGGTNLPPKPRPTARGNETSGPRQGADPRRNGATRAGTRATAPAGAQAGPRPPRAAGAGDAARAPVADAAARPEAARRQTSQRAFAAAQALDGVDSGQANAPSAAHAARAQVQQSQRATEADLRRVAQQVVLSPIVLPAPAAAPMTPAQAGRFLTRLTALSGLGAALVAAQAGGAEAQGQPPASDANPDSLAATAAPSAASNTLGQALTPQMRRYLKNDLKLSPRAIRYLSGLPTQAAPQGGPAAAALPQAAVLAALPLSRAAATPAATASSTASDVPVGAGLTAPSGPSTYTVTMADGTTTTVSLPQVHFLTGHVSWATIATLLRKDQLEAVFAMTLLRQIEIRQSVQNELLTEQNALSKVQNEVSLERLEVANRLLNTVVNARQSMDRSPVNLLTNKNEKLPRLQNPYNLTLERGIEDAIERSKMAEVALQLAASQRAAGGDLLARTNAGKDVLNVVPATSTAPQANLVRHTLAPAEEEALTGAQRGAYLTAKTRLAVLEEKNASGKYGRYTTEAARMEQAAQQTQQAAQEAGARGDAGTQARYAALAGGYAARATQFRALAGQSGYEGALWSASRQHRASIQMAVMEEQEDLKKLQAGRAKAPANQHLFYDLAIEDRQHRLGGMARAAQACEALDGQQLISQQLSGTRGHVEQADEAVGALLTSSKDSPAHQEARRSIAQMGVNNHAEVAQANVLSSLFHYMRRYPTEEAQHAMGQLANDNTPAPELQGARRTIENAMRAAGGQLLNYDELAAATSKQRMVKHVAQRAQWQTGEEDKRALAAEAKFWQLNDKLTLAPVQNTGRVRNLLRSISPISFGDGNNAPQARTGIRVGAASAQPAGAAAAPTRDAALAGLHQFRRANGVNLLDPAAHSAHTASGARAAASWSQGFRDPQLSRLTMRIQPITRALQEGSDQFERNTKRIEDDADELVGLLNEDRQELYGAIQAEQGATLAMAQQLLGLLKVPG